MRTSSCGDGPQCEARQGTRPADMADGEGIRRQAAPAAKKSLHFSDPDGRFLPETALQAAAIISLHCDLQTHFHGVRDVVVGGSMFIYYDPSEIRRSISVDDFVVLDHDLGRRPTYNRTDGRTASRQTSLSR